MTKMMHERPSPRPLSSQSSAAVAPAFTGLARHVVPQGKPAARIPSELFAGCQVCASRHELVTKFPQGARIAEVGTFRGAFARHILTACAPAELHVIDLELSQLNPTVAEDDRVQVHPGASHIVLAGFPDAYFDWIYIDAGPLL